MVFLNTEFSLGLLVNIGKGSDHASFLCSHYAFSIVIRMPAREVATQNEVSISFSRFTRESRESVRSRELLTQSLCSFYCNYDEVLVSFFDSLLFPPLLELRNFKVMLSLKCKYSKNYSIDDTPHPFWMKLFLWVTLNQKVNVHPHLPVNSPFEMVGLGLVPREKSAT